MDFLLFVGAPSVGKTEAITRVVDYLVNKKGFVQIHHEFINKHKIDFLCVLNGKNKSGKSITIIVSSAGDNQAVINKFNAYIKNNNNPPCDFIIGATRDVDDRYKIRSYFMNTIVTPNRTPNSICFEIPLAEITRKGKLRATALQWYRDKIDIIVNNNILANAPFGI